MKYRNQKTEINGITFDSKKEATRYQELLWLQQAGKIAGLDRQVKFVLIPAQKIDGKVVERECAYYADFVYYDKDKGKVVEDTKGVKTKDYIIKRKLMLERYGVRISEV